jgi:hypothetical protein
MRKLCVSFLILLILALTSGACASSRKTDRRLKALMLQENTKLGRNKEYNSKHNKKTKRSAYRKYNKNRKYRVQPVKTNRSKNYNSMNTLPFEPII